MPILRKISGFTLIEVITTVAMLSLLLIIIISRTAAPTFMKARDVKRKTDLQKMARIMEDYYNENGHYPPADPDTPGTIEDTPWGASFTPYASVLPKDPGNTTSEYYYEAQSGGGDYFVIYAQLETSDDPDISLVGCGEGCGPGNAYDYAVHSTNVVMLAGMPNFTPGTGGGEEEEEEPPPPEGDPGEPSSTPASLPTITDTPTPTPLPPTPTTGPGSCSHGQIFCNDWCGFEPGAPGVWCSFETCCFDSENWIWKCSYLPICL